MQSFKFLDCFGKKLSKKNLWGSTGPLGKERVNSWLGKIYNFNLNKNVRQQNPTPHPPHPPAKRPRDVSLDKIDR